MEINDLYNKSYEMRIEFVKMFSKLGYGHLTTAFSETEILITLLEKIIRFDGEKKPIDRFFLSKGHGAGMIFPILVDMGIFSQEEMENIIRKGGKFELLRDYFLPGFEFYGGSLGIGIGMAAGMALGLRLNRTDEMVYCLVGDAECYEGSVWEAALFAAHNRLNNLIVIVDRNYLGCSDFTENMCELNPFADKWRACNWIVEEIDGHYYEDLLRVLCKAKTRSSSKPLCIIANTVKGKGIEYLCNQPLNHGYMPVNEEAKKAIDSINI